ncbi:MAG: hypothetical protein HY306_03940 [Nitrosomonadales bacterium]|nr:hypothetical protein [Nitrosomonadales bacterium]
MNTFDVVRAAAGGMAVVPEKQAGEIVGGISVKTLRNLRAEGKELLPTMRSAVAGMSVSLILLNSLTSDDPNLFP